MLSVGRGKARKLRATLSGSLRLCSDMIFAWSVCMPWIQASQMTKSSGGAFSSQGGHSLPGTRDQIFGNKNTAYHSVSLNLLLKSFNYSQ